MKSRYNPVLLAVIVIGLVCALWLNYSRYIAQPTKYYSTEGTNLYFAMKKDGEPIDPIEYLP